METKNAKWVRIYSCNGSGRIITTIQNSNDLWYIEL